MRNKVTETCYDVISYFVYCLPTKRCLRIPLAAANTVWRG